MSVTTAENPLIALIDNSDKMAVELLKLEGDLRSGEVIPNDVLIVFLQGMREHAQSMATLMRSIQSLIDAEVA